MFGGVLVQVEAWVDCGVLLQLHRTAGRAILSCTSLLLRLIFQERDQIVPVLVLLETTECHLRAWNVLLWVLEVLKLELMLSRCSSNPQTCLLNLPVCPGSTRCLSACWLLCMRILPLDQCVGRTIHGD